MIRRIGNMVQMVGQGAVPVIRSRATSNAKPDLSAFASTMLRGEVVAPNDDGTYEVFIASPTEGGLRENCAAITDEPLLAGSVVWVQKTVYGTWVVLGAAKG